jgi:sugar lactone lactonase YvrE
VTDGRWRWLAAGFGLLEAARWYPGTGLLFSDMTRGGVYRIACDETRPEVVVPHRKGIGGLVAHADGGLVISGRNVARKRGEETTVLLETAPDEQFFNDITADATGRLYAGSMPRPGVEAGRLYRLGTDGGVEVLADDVLASNGLAVDPAERQLLHVDSLRKVVWRFALADPSMPREVFVDTGEYEGVPDGLALAGDGSVWVAIAGSGLVVGWDAAGRRIAELTVPAALVTSVCFGGPGLDVLYVLTGVNDEYPAVDGGAVLATPAPCTGLPAPSASIYQHTG